MKIQGESDSGQAIAKVTIAIPTLNRADYLRQAIASALAQTYKEIEVIVSNNACTDHTESVLNSFCDSRLRVLFQCKPLPMMENWNACLNAASGRYFLLLSDDDLLEPTAIEEMVAAYEKESGVGFVYCKGRTIDEDGKILSVAPSAPKREEATNLIVAFLDGKRSLWPCVILFRLEDMANGYQSRFPLGADAAQWITVVASRGSARFIDNTLAQYRVHRNTTFTTPVEVWRAENAKLGEFAIFALAENGRSSESTPRKIHNAVRRLNVRITSEIINQASRKQLITALSQYWRNRAVFRSPYAFAILFRGLISLVLPEVFRQKVRRTLNS